MRKRIRNVLSLLPDQSTDIRLRAACTVVNTAIDPDGCLGQRSASSLLRVVGDRAQLAQFDHLLALEIAQQVSGIRGVRAFRRISPAALRNIYNLLSLVHERNRFGKRRPS
jgi:hypothetical protein